MKAPPNFILLLAQSEHRKPKGVIHKSPPSSLSKNKITEHSTITKQLSILPGNDSSHIITCLMRSKNSGTGSQKKSAVQKKESAEMTTLDKELAQS